MPRRLLVALTLTALAACGPSSPTPMTPTPEPVAPVPTGTGATAATPWVEPTYADDPVVVGLTVDGEKHMCDEHLATAKRLVERIKALKGAPAEALTYEATLGRLDQAVLETVEAGQMPYLMAVAHPDAAVREAAKLCEPKTDKFNTALYLDADLAEVIKAYAAKNEPLAGERKRLLADVLRDFKRNGLNLGPAEQDRLRHLNEEATKLGQDFEANIAGSGGKIEISAKQMAGLPKEYVEKHKPGKNGKIEITTDYPDYFPFVTYAVDRRAALDLYVAFTNRGGEENVQILERLLKLRREKANLLGYPTWADYAIEPRMAHTAKTVRDFLTEVRDAVREPAKAEMAELLAVHARMGGKKTDALPPSDRYFLSDRVKEQKYKLDSKALHAYFPVDEVRRGLLELASKMYGITFQAVRAQSWHQDVSIYDVFGPDKKPMGRVYLDLFSRPDKYKHAAMFPIRTPALLPDGKYLQPIAALECNFPKPSGAEPALMSHEDVVTFFHEFGHVLHHLLTKSKLATYAGSNTVRDFVEAPSQMFEEWAWSREVLDGFAKHYQTGAKIPDELFKAMTKARTFGRALDTQRQVFLALLDQELHTRAPGFDSTKVVEEVQNATDSFPYVKGTHFQSSFGHLIGYDAGYYSYQWALALSRDVLTRFRKEGLLNPATAAAWRDEVLSRGGGEDERSMVKAFLGREPSNAAYFAYLRGQE